MSRSTIYRVAERFCPDGEAGLIDRREDNGDIKLDEAFLSQLYTVAHGSPLDYQWRRVKNWLNRRTKQNLAAYLAI